MRGAVTLALATFLVACVSDGVPVPEVEVEVPPAPSVGVYKVGNPYQIAGVWYYPREQADYDETGIGSWYGAQFHGRLTANGEVFDRNGITAAHPTLPLPANVRVTDLESGRSIVVRVNDRGPFVNGRIIDLSERAAELLGYRERGTARVRVAFLGRADLDSQATLTMAEATPVEIATAVPPAPTARIAAAILAPIEGASMAEARTVESLPSPVAPPPSLARDTAEPDGVVSLMPVPVATAIYVQAGAFASFANADRVAMRLSGAGAQISEVTIGGKQMFRVRMGPYQDVEMADAILSQVQTLGHHDVEVVVE